MMSTDTDAATMPAPTHLRRSRRNANATRRPKIAANQATDIDDAIDPSLPLSELEEKYRIYVDYEPQMRAQKKDMYSCVHDDEHELILQRIPRDPPDIQYKTTCGHMYCKAWNGVFEPGAYRVSVGMCISGSSLPFICGSLSSGPCSSSKWTACAPETCRSLVENSLVENADSENSIEEMENFDSESPFSGAIPLEPLHKWSSSMARCKRLPAN